VHNLEKHLGVRLFDMVISNNCYTGELPAGIQFTRTEPELIEEYSVYSTDLINKDKAWRHDSQKLAQTIMDLFFERTGPLQDRDKVMVREVQEKI
jgi:hypothetical protein